MSADQEAVRATRALAVTLNGLGDALVHLDLAGMLEAEPALDTALASLRQVERRLRVTPERERFIGLRKELEAARVALRRCASLGRSLDVFARRPADSTTSYTAAGARVTGPRRSAFNQSV